MEPSLRMDLRPYLIIRQHTHTVPEPESNRAQLNSYTLKSCLKPPAGLMDITSGRASSKRGADPCYFCSILTVVLFRYSFVIYMQYCITCKQCAENPKRFGNHLLHKLFEQTGGVDP